MNFEALLLLFLFIYFLPLVIAEARNHDALYFIFGINLILGWTIIGWLIALVWAFTTPHPEAVVTPPIPPAAGDDETHEERIPCPFCAEKILAAAKVCKHCHAALSPPDSPSS